MKEQLEIKVLETSITKSFEYTINKMIEEGWKVSSTNIYKTPHGEFFYQAILILEV